jgi:hypothetical protein
MGWKISGKRRAYRAQVGRLKMVNVLILRTPMECRTPVALSKRRDRTVRVIKEEEEEEEEKNDRKMDTEAETGPAR